MTFFLDCEKTIWAHFSCEVNVIYVCVAGTYECGFISGSITHKAKAKLKVALLPDEITMKVNPLTADCSEKMSTDSIQVEATAIILNSTAEFEVTGFYRETEIGPLTPECKRRIQISSFLPSLIFAVKQRV